MIPDDAGTSPKVTRFGSNTKVPGQPWALLPECESARAFCPFASRSCRNICINTVLQVSPFPKPLKLVQIYEEWRNVRIDMSAGHRAREHLHPGNDIAGEPRWPSKQESSHRVGGEGRPRLSVARQRVGFVAGIGNMRKARIGSAYGVIVERPVTQHVGR